MNQSAHASREMYYKMRRLPYFHDQFSRPLSLITRNIVRVIDCL